MSIGETGSSAGPSSTSRRLGAAVLGLLHSHVELFGIELQEQKARTVSLLLFAGWHWCSPCCCWWGYRRWS
jgi:uncharacterized membrane protein YqjE